MQTTSSKRTLDEGGPARAGLAVVSTPLAEQVFNSLRASIVNGELPPGHHLRVRDVADQAGTSVMPVRIAISQLVEAGLATQEPYKGARVRGFDVTELEELYDLRILLEAAAARLGAERADADVVARMERHWAELQEAAGRGEVTRALQADEELLSAVYEVAGNSLLVSMIRGLWDRSWPYKVLWADNADRPTDLHMWRSKPRLIEAVRGNAGDLAAEAVRESYASAKEEIRATLARTRSA